MMSLKNFILKIIRGNGMLKKYHKNGQLEVEENYKNGQLEAEGNFKEGKQESLWKNYY